MGVRSAGGVADVMSSPSLDTEDYYTRLLFDLLFFVIVIVLLQNIILAVIIDMFAELQHKRVQMQNKQESRLH